MDQSEVRREEIPEEARLHGDTHQRREEVGAAVEREEVSETQQRHHGTESTPEIPTRARKHLPLHPLRRYVNNM